MATGKATVRDADSSSVNSRVHNATGDAVRAAQNSGASKADVIRARDAAAAKEYKSISAQISSAGSGSGKLYSELTSESKHVIGVQQAGVDLNALTTSFKDSLSKRLESGDSNSLNATREALNAGIRAVETKNGTIYFAKESELKPADSNLNSSASNISYKRAGTITNPNMNHVDNQVSFVADRAIAEAKTLGLNNKQALNYRDQALKEYYQDKVSFALNGVGPEADRVKTELEANPRHIERATNLGVIDSSGNIIQDNASKKNEVFTMNIDPEMHESLFHKNSLTETLNQSLNSQKVSVFNPNIKEIAKAQGLEFDSNDFIIQMAPDTAHKLRSGENFSYNDKQIVVLRNPSLEEMAKNSFDAGPLGQTLNFLKNNENPSLKEVTEFAFSIDPFGGKKSLENDLGVYWNNAQDVVWSNGINTPRQDFHLLLDDKGVGDKYRETVKDLKSDAMSAVVPIYALNDVQKNVYQTLRPDSELPAHMRMIDNVKDAQIDFIDGVVEYGIRHPLDTGAAIGIAAITKKVAGPKIASLEKGIDPLTNRYLKGMGYASDAATLSELDRYAAGEGNGMKDHIKGYISGEPKPLDKDYFYRLGYGTGDYFTSNPLRGQSKILDYSTNSYQVAKHMSETADSLGENMNNSRYLRYLEGYPDDNEY